MSARLGLAAVAGGVVAVGLVAGGVLVLGFGSGSSSTTDAVAQQAGAAPVIPTLTPRPTTPTVTPPVPVPASTRPAPAPTATTSGTAYLSVPAAGISHLKIVTYSGDPDDTRGTEINDSGLVGAPHGSWGGVGPGQVGNLLLTAHRTSAGAPMGDVPNLSRGDKVYVDQGDARYVYVVESKTMINFRSAASRALQSAAVPGSPGKKATRPAIVLSTCATPEDNAAGDTFRDEHGNPTHRIAVYGYLQSVAPRK